MKENKIAIKWLINLFVISIITAISLEWKLDKIIITIMSGHRAFVINILLGILASSILTLIIATITYKVKRKELLNDYYIIVGKHIQNINFFGSEISSHKSDESLTEHLKKMSPKIKELQFAYIDIVSIHSNLTFFKRDKNVISCVNNINTLIGNLQLKLAPIQYVAEGWSIPKNDELMWFTSFSPEDCDLVELNRQHNNLRSLLNIYVSTSQEKNNLEK